MAGELQRTFLETLQPVYDRLSRYALAVTRNEMDAEDLVSETVLRAFEQFTLDQETDRFLHYLITIASRLYRRGRYRQRRWVPYDAERAAARPDMQASSPETAAEIRIVMDALNLLPQKIRETVVLFDISDFSLEEIRVVQGGTLSGVKSRLKRGRERLAASLGVAAPHLRTPPPGNRRPAAAPGVPLGGTPHVGTPQEGAQHLRERVLPNTILPAGNKTTTRNIPKTNARRTASAETRMIVIATE